MFFKGYVRTKNKKCLEPFKNRKDFSSYEQIREYDEFAGILAEDTILIDIDDHEQSEKLLTIVKDMDLRTRVYRTSRGMHFLFRNTNVGTNRGHAPLAVGLYADVKIGSRNAYSILKFEGKEREIVYDTATDEEADYLPRWLTPMRKPVEFLGMKAGDGRNQSMFDYILTLTSCDFTKEEARETLRIINQYILSDPLSESELETVYRDNAFPEKMFYRSGRFMFDEFATFMKNEDDIIRIDGNLHIYMDGYYSGNPRDIEHAMIGHISSLSRTKRNEIMEYLELIVRTDVKRSDARYICFGNGVYDVRTDRLLEHSPEFIITNRIDWDWNPEAYSPIIDEVLDDLSSGKRDIRMLLEETVGYCMWCTNELGKCIIFLGSHSNGKSTFLDMIKTMLGDRNISALGIDEMNERFKLAEAFGKMANLGDDISDEYIPNTAIFKKLVTGDRLTAERKGRDPFEFNNYAKLIFSANSIPRLGKGRDNDALMRRLVIIPMRATFTKDSDKYDPFIKYKLRGQESMEYLIQLGIKGLRRILMSNSFTESKEVQEELDMFADINNPISGFFREISEDDIYNEPTSAVYKKYNEYCIRNGIKQPLSRVVFSKEVNNHFHTKTKQARLDGRKCQVFMKESEKNEE